MRFGCDVSEERGAELDSTRILILAVMILIHKGPSVLPNTFTPPTWPQSRVLESHVGCYQGLPPCPPPFSHLSLF